MHVISRKALKDAALCHPDAGPALDVWYRIAKRVQWNSIEDVRAQFPHADAVGTCVVFNVRGNRYRLIVKIHFHRECIYVRGVLTHAEYSKGDWKSDCQ